MWTEERTGIGMHQESEERRERRGSGNQEHGPGSLGQTSVTRITDSSLPHSVFISGPMFPVKDSVALVAGRGILRRLHPTMAAAATRREYRGTSSQRIGIRSSLIRTGSLILLILSLMPQLFLAVSITDSMRETGSGSGSPVSLSFVFLSISLPPLLPL